jgi:CheY-like chemotaxis protein
VPCRRRLGTLNKFLTSDGPGRVGLRPIAGRRARRSRSTLLWAQNCFKLPPMSLDERAPESADLGASVVGLRVLVAEDTPITQAMMRMRLTKMGCEVSVVENGREAVTAVKAKPFDCILMDYHMPVLDGAEATKEIRAWEEGQNKPGIYIAAFTATSQTNDHNVLMAAGMDDILVKPMAVTKLTAVLQRAAARR